MIRFTIINGRVYLDRSGGWPRSAAAEQVEPSRPRPGTLDAAEAAREVEPLGAVTFAPLPAKARP